MSETRRRLDRHLPLALLLVVVALLAWLVSLQEDERLRARARTPRAEQHLQLEEAATYSRQLLDAAAASCTSP